MQRKLENTLVCLIAILCIKETCVVEAICSAGTRSSGKVAFVECRDGMRSLRVADVKKTVVPSARVQT